MTLAKPFAFNLGQPLPACRPSTNLTVAQLLSQHLTLTSSWPASHRPLLGTSTINLSLNVSPVSDCLSAHPDPDVFLFALGDVSICRDHIWCQWSFVGFPDLDYLPSSSSVFNIIQHIYWHGVSSNLYHRRLYSNPSSELCGDTRGARNSLVTVKVCNLTLCQRGPG
jgi:hypothetical protein